MDFNDVIQRNKKYKFQNYQKAVCFKDVPLDHVANETEMRNRCVALLHQRHNFFKYQSHTTQQLQPVYPLQLHIIYRVRYLYRKPIKSKCIIQYIV